MKVAVRVDTVLDIQQHVTVTSSAMTVGTVALILT